MIFVRRFHVSDIMNPWYGKVYMDRLRPDMVVCMLIPFNLVARFIRAMWWRVYRGLVGVTAEERFKCAAYEECRKRADELCDKAWEDIRSERMRLQAEWDILARINATSRPDTLGEVMLDG